MENTFLEQCVGPKHPANVILMFNVVAGCSVNTVVRPLGVLQ